MFDDRADAGEQLANLLEERDVEADIVLGIPRGGLPVARPVADRLDASLDIVTAKKLGLPGNPEFEYDADEVVAVESPPHFGAVGAFYRDFEQVSDQEAREYLDWPAPAD